MTGIHVLSTGVSSSKSKEERFSVADTQQGSEGVVMDFAAILSGWAQQISGQGQTSGFQSNDPAGKEANSGPNAMMGVDAVQVLMGAIPGYSSQQQLMPETVLGEQRTKDDKPFQSGLGQMREALGMLNEADLLAQVEKLKHESVPFYPIGNMGEGLRTGMKPEQPQGNRFPQSELDQYKEVISNLLQGMSGEIKEVPQTKSDSVSSSMQQKAELVMHRLNTGLFTIDLDEQSSLQASSVTGEILEHVRETSSSTSNKAFLGVPIDSQVVSPLKNPDETQLSKGLIQADEPLDQAFRQMINPRPPLDSQGIQEGPHGSGFSEEQVQSTPFSLPGKERSQESAWIKESFDVKIDSELKLDADEENPIFLHGEGLEEPRLAKENIRMLDKAGTKENLPIWAQVAREIHEKAFRVRPQIKELDIHLHPAELGQIRIFLSWEDGQVHLRMTASEPATGQALQSTLTELRGTLSQMGVQCGMLEMGLGNQSKNSRQQQGQEILQTLRENRDDSQGIQSITSLESMSGGNSVESNGAGSQINVTA